MATTPFDFQTYVETTRIQFQQVLDMLTDMKAELKAQDKRHKDDLTTLWNKIDIHRTDAERISSALSLAHAKQEGAIAMVKWLFLICGGVFTAAVIGTVSMVLNVSVQLEKLHNADAAIAYQVDQIKQHMGDPRSSMSIPPPTVTRK